MELLLCHNKKKLRSNLNVKGRQKRGRDKKGRKVLGFNCVRRIQREKWRDMKGSRDNVIWQCVPVLVCVYAECVPARWQSLHLVHRPGCAEYEREEMGEWTGSLMRLCAEVNSQTPPSPFGCHWSDRQKDRRVSRRQGDDSENDSLRFVADVQAVRLITASRDGVNEHQEMERRGRPRSITPDRHLDELSESETDWF